MLFFCCTVHRNLIKMKTLMEFGLVASKRSLRCDPYVLLFLRSSIVKKNGCSLSAHQSLMLFLASLDAFHFIWGWQRRISSLLTFVETVRMEFTTWWTGISGTDGKDNEALGAASPLSSVKASMSICKINTHRLRDWVWELDSMYS